MRKFSSFIIFLTLFSNVHAQYNGDNTAKGKFDKKNIFTGGNVSLAFYTGTFAAGIGPHIGYSITKWLDAAVAVNYNYISQNDGYNKIRQSDIGPGAFIRVFPVNFLYAQVQYEQNFIRQKEIYSTGYTNIFKANAASLLLGAGYTSGREPGENTYYYLTLMFDAMNNINSPYLDQYGRKIPVVRVGYNIALFQGGGRHRK